MSEHRHQPDLDRRRFLISSAAATLGLGVLDLGRRAWAAPQPPQIRRFRRLGRTGLEISDISFGSSRTTDPDLVRYALERGVNYFDTAERYEDGRSEKAIGEGLEGKRDQVILASKVKAGPSKRRAEIMESLEGSLERLRTDHIDIYFSHAVNNLARLQNDEWFEFADRAKGQGKIRFTGISGHGGKLVKCLDYALDHDLFDVILCAYNFGQDPAFHERFTSRLDWVALQPELPRVLEKARAKDVGVVAMKTLRGARLADMRPYEQGDATFAQAAFRWVLSNPNVNALVISMTSREEIDEFVSSSRHRGGPSRAAPTWISSRGTCHRAGMATATTAARPARRAVRTGFRFRRCFGPGCTRRTTATATTRVGNTRSSRWTPPPVSPAPSVRAWGAVRRGSRFRGSPAPPTSC
jgi:aryl-alcohol dehydrogenase-like predicted oxidoreductase